MLSTPNYLEKANKIYSKPFVESYLNRVINNGASLPLWSTSNGFEKQYFQVEVMAEKEIPLLKSTDDILNMNTITCHICDTEVPKSHVEEHNNGEKHKTFMRIADLALERTRKHMKLNMKPSLSVQVTETYFCEPCAVIVQKVDKIEHEKSGRHVKSLRHDELLKDFLMIYEDKENIDSIAKKSNDIILDISDSMEDISDSPENGDNVTNNNDAIDKPIHETPNVATNNQIQNELQAESDENVINTEAKPEPPKTGKSYQENLQTVISKQIVNQLSEGLTQYFLDKFTNPITKAEKKENIQKASNELINYLKNITEKCKIDPIHTIEAITDKVIMITAINGDKIKVPVVNFHSMHKQKDKSYCKICEDPNAGFRHEESEEHMGKIMIPIEDKNAIRKIDDIWSHCVLCNDLTKNITFHLQSLLHRNKLKHCLIDSGTDINENIVQKSNSQKEDTSQLILEHSLIISHDNTEISCNICDITIPNKVPSIRNHIKTFDHITNYNATIGRHKLNEIDDQQYYCIPCDMCVSKCYALGHCNGKKHNKHLTDLLSNENVETEEESTQILPSISQQIRRTNIKQRQNTNSDLICFVCNVVLYNVDKHMNSLEHKKNYFSYLEANKLNEIEEDTFYCIPCNTVILIDYLMYHCTSKKHKTLLKNFISNAENQDVSKTQTCQIIAENSHISRSITQSVQNAQTASTSKTNIVSQNGIFNTAIPIKFLYQFRELSNSRNLLCTICDEEVPYRKYDVQTHVNIIDHIIAYNLMMLWNKIKRMNDKYFCDICKVDITYFNELSHITSRQHVDVMAKQPKGTVYEYDKTLLTLEYAMSHKVGDRVRPSSLLSVTKPLEANK